MDPGLFENEGISRDSFIDHMQAQDQLGLEWPDNEATMHHLSTANTRGNLHPSIIKSVRDETTMAHESRRKQRLNKARADTSDLRDQVARLRLELRELRVELQQRSGEIWDMQGRFWQELRSKVDSHAMPTEALEELHDQIQKHLDGIGPTQALYDEKEDDLIFNEYQLGKQEARLYDLDSRVEEGPVGAFGDSPSIDSSPRSPSFTQRFTGDESSLAYRYFSKVGDANIVKERLLELAEQKAHYLDLERERVSMGLELYQPNVDFLRSFDDVYDNHLKELQKIGEELQKLEPSLFEEDRHIRPHGEAHSDPCNISLRAQSSRLEDTSRGEIHRRKSDGDVVYLPVDTWSMHHRVGQWILKYFGASSAWGARQQIIFDDPDLDEKTWWSLVKEYWQRDRATQPFSSSPDESSKLSTLATSRTLGGRKPSLTLDEGTQDHERFFDYPLETAAPDISWKSRAMADSFDMCFSPSSPLDDEDFSFHDGSEKSARF